MIENIVLLRNITQFESVSEAANLPLKKLTLVYAENGRGKTSLAAVLKSLGTGNPEYISERKRINSDHNPHAVINIDGKVAQFKNNSWDINPQNIEVFDDFFVNDNIFSGLSIESNHRQKLHELIIGAQGVSLNSALIDCITKVEEHIKELRRLSKLFPVDALHGIAIDDFCALPEHTNINQAISETKQALEAAKDQNTISRMASFEDVKIAEIKLQTISELLEKTIDSIEKEAADEVQKHFSRYKGGVERWVMEGLDLSNEKECPFCSEPLEPSAVVKHYQSYFSSEYKSFRNELMTARRTLENYHNGEARAAFERSFRAFMQRFDYWSKFIELPRVELDPKTLALKWRAAYDQLHKALVEKEGTPLNKVNLDQEGLEAVKDFEKAKDEFQKSINELIKVNVEINIIKEKATSGNIAALTADYKRLQAIKSRYSEEVNEVCNLFLKEKSRKLKTEENRERLKAELDQYQKDIFPKFNLAINDYLRKFGANFRLEEMSASSTRGGASCNYNLVIYKKSVSVGGRIEAGMPSFKNTLSAGDRNTLALAFFFASLDMDSSLSKKTVVIDDPMTSLDDHRTLTTAQEIRMLANRASQVISLSHSKPFLCRIWKNHFTDQKSALIVQRKDQGSTICEWDVSEDQISEYDRNHQKLRNYLSNPDDPRGTAIALRPVLEGFMRVTCPEYFPPGTMLGKFIRYCKSQLTSGSQILSEVKINELDNIKEYANKFHHDSNPAWETEAINDQQLNGFVSRVLDFVKLS